MVKFSIFKKTIKMMACVLVFSSVTNMSAQSTSQEVKLIVSGDGMTKDEATKVALRSAIEQAYGTFVSSNTELLNDNLVKDDIVTVSSGNIKTYEYLGEQELDGRYYVTLNAVVSIGKLIEYARAKGSEAELAGALFLQNIQMEELYAANEQMALRNLVFQMGKLYPYCFDYEITNISEPEVVGQYYVISLDIQVTTTHTAEDLFDTFWNTIKNCSKDVVGELDILENPKTHKNAISIGDAIGSPFFTLRNSPFRIVQEMFYMYMAQFKMFRLFDDMGDLTPDPKPLWIWGMDTPRPIEDRTREVKINKFKLTKERSNSIIVYDSSKGYLKRKYPGKNNILSTCCKEKTVIGSMKARVAYTKDQLAKLSSIKISPIDTNPMADKINELYKKDVEYISDSFDIERLSRRISLSPGDYWEAYYIKDEEIVEVFKDGIHYYTYNLKE